MNDKDLDKIWLAQLFESEQILPIQHTYLDKKNIEINTIIFPKTNLSNSDIGFLEKILQACDIQNHTYEIQYQSYPFKNLRQIYPNIENIFLFGKDVQELGVNFRLQNIDNCQISNVNIIQAPNIELLASDNNLKTYYWTQVLKPIFTKK